jgi:hypothetical protein
MAVGRHQLAVRSLLEDAALFDDHNALGTLGGRQAVGDDDPQRLQKVGEGEGSELQEG